MRWYNYNPAHNEERVISWFAWLPVTIGYHEAETRWLEKVTVEQRYDAYAVVGWENERFVKPSTVKGGA